MTQWFLEGYIDTDGALRHIPLEAFPVLVGRQSGLTLAGASANMSRYHAELVERDGRLIVRDLGSKNGTFVNRQRIDNEATIEAGDVVHFADAEFRVGSGEVVPADTNGDTAAGVFAPDRLPEHFPPGAGDVYHLLEQGAVDAVYQPMIALATGRQAGQECLSRGTWSSLPAAPDDLLRVAQSVGREVELSELMRRRAVEQAGAAGLSGPTFVNIHPSEVHSLDRLLGQLWELRKAWPELELVLELHEAAVTNLAAVESLHRQLRLFGIALAYDDFGAGQARLMELAAVPPRYLKFDITLVRDIDRAPDQRRRMVGMLVSFARETGIVTLAEGITREEEAEACEALGFDWGQGYYFGEPEPLA